MTKHEENMEKILAAKEAAKKVPFPTEKPEVPSINKILDSFEEVACKGKPVVCSGCGDIWKAEDSFHYYDLMICVRGHSEGFHPHRRWHCRFCQPCSEKMWKQIQDGKSITEPNMPSNTEIISRIGSVIDREVNQRTDRIASKVLGVFADFIQKKKIKLGAKQSEELKTALFRAHDKPSFWTSVTPMAKPRKKK